MLTVSMGDLDEVDRFLEYLKDLTDKKMSPKDFAEKWAVYMAVSRADAENYKRGVKEK